MFECCRQHLLRRFGPEVVRAGKSGSELVTFPWDALVPTGTRRASSGSSSANMGLSVSGQDHNIPGSTLHQVNTWQRAGRSQRRGQPSKAGGLAQQPGWSARCRERVSVLHFHFSFFLPPVYRRTLLRRWPPRCSRVGRHLLRRFHPVSVRSGSRSGGAHHFTWWPCTLEAVLIQLLLARQSSRRVVREGQRGKDLMSSARTTPVPTGTPL